MSINYRRIGTSLAAGIASALLVAAMPAQASAPDAAGKGASAPSDQPAAAKPAKPTRYCVVETITGSRIEQRTCLTKKEWADRGIDITHPDRD